jgi:hypothetical protein
MLAYNVKMVDFVGFYALSDDVKNDKIVPKHALAY